MRRFRRHPSRMQLETWFDGEAPEALAWHVATCGSCFRHVDKLSRIRGAVRAGVPAAPPAGVPVPAPAPAPVRRSSVRALVAVPVVVLLAAGLLAGVGAGQGHGSASAARGQRNTAADDAGLHRAGRNGGTGADAHGQHPGASGDAASGTGTAGGSAAQAGTGEASTGHGTSPAPGLRLALVVPTAGAAAADGTEVTKAVQQAVAEADAAGGVSGGPVQLTVVSAGDTPAIAALPGQVSAVVGGFGFQVPSGVPWILPADPWASGPDVVSTELSPRAAGARLGYDLLRRGAAGTVGVIQGTGPDADLATGLAAEVRTTTVQAPSNGTCLPAVTSLEAQGVVAVAVAGPPSLAMACVSALSAGPWTPPGGILVPPSAAYAGIASAGVGAGSDVYTALGMPWPTSSSPGAARFRAALPGITSYRALVSYAAVELAVAVARAAGSPSVSDMGGRTWQNDLYDFAGVDNAGVQVVQTSTGGWVGSP